MDADHEPTQQERDEWIALGMSTERARCEAELAALRAFPARHGGLVRALQQADDELHAIRTELADLRAERDRLRGTLEQIAKFTAPDRGVLNLSPAAQFTAIHNTARAALNHREEA